VIKKGKGQRRHDLARSPEAVRGGVAEVQTYGGDGGLEALKRLIKGRERGLPKEERKQ